MWPPLGQHWRHTHLGIGIFCLVTMLPLALLLRRAPTVQPNPNVVPVGAGGFPRASHNGLQLILAVAGLACCVAMSMPQVHIVA